MVATREDLLQRIAAAGGAPMEIDDRGIATAIGYSSPAEVLAARWDGAGPDQQRAAEQVRDDAGAEGWEAAVSIDQEHGVVDLLVHRLAGSSRRGMARTCRPAPGYTDRVDGLVSAWYAAGDEAVGGAIRRYQNCRLGTEVRVARSPRVQRGYDVFLGRRRLTGKPLPTRQRAVAYAFGTMRRQGDRR